MAKKKILIVDDEAAFAQIVKFNLEKTGKYEVKVENQGSRGLASAQMFLPDLILLDVVMPDKAGSDVAQELGDHLTTRNIPIIFLTAIVSRGETNAQTRMIGGHPFLAKPVGPTELVNCIEEHLAGKKPAWGEWLSKVLDRFRLS